MGREAEDGTHTNTHRNKSICVCVCAAKKRLTLPTLSDTDVHSLVELIEFFSVSPTEIVKPVFRNNDPQGWFVVAAIDSYIFVFLLLKWLFVFAASAMLS